MNPQKMAWEQRYSDDSGVEYAVRYDATRYANSGDKGVVQFEAVNVVEFPMDKLDWLIDCLTAVREAAKP